MQKPDLDTMTNVILNNEYKLHEEEERKEEVKEVKPKQNLNKNKNKQKLCKLKFIENK